MADENAPKMVVGKPVKIVRKNPDNIRSIPVNDVLISHTDYDFFITFSAVEPPPILEEKEFDELVEVEAIARVKLVVTPAFAEALLKVLSTNVERFKQDHDGPN